MTQPNLITNDDLNAELCTVDGSEHDYRPYTYPIPGTRRTRTSLRCVWCHVVACGDYGESDPCIEPHHHAVPHRTATGATWALGGCRNGGDAS